MFGLQHSLPCRSYSPHNRFHHAQDTSQRRLALLEHLRPFSAFLADFLLSARFDRARRKPLEFVLEVGRSCLPQRRSSGQVGIAPSEIIDQIRERP